MHLLELPDDVLAEVMQRLAVPDVMSCRLVCKRLAAASQCSDVWRLRELDSHDRYAAAVLRLAPCLESLHISGSSQLSRLLFRTTRCAVRVLRLSWLSSSDAATAREVVRNQAALGRLVALRFFDVTVFWTSQKLWSTLLTSGLEQLYLGASLSAPWPVCFRDAPRLPSDYRPSLKCFHCDGYGEHVRILVDYILAGHAATLEEVSVSRSLVATFAAYAPPSLPLLATMPKLRKLTCYPMPGMQQAEATSGSLKTVVLEVADRDSYGAVRDAAELLRRAEAVREVTLSLESEHSLCADLVLAVGPSVESLTLLIGKVTSGPSLQSRRAPASGRLLRALRAPRALRRLELRWRAWREVLSSITPYLFPDLRTLVLSMRKEDQERLRCLNNLVGESAVRQLLTTNPLLKLIVLNLPKYCCGQMTPCWACCQCDRFAGATEYTRVATCE